MAKSLYEITLDYNMAIKQAEALESIAGELKGMADTNLQECLNQISANWKGTNAQNYARKAQQLKAQMQGSVKKLNQTAATIRSIAERTKEAESKAYYIALSSGK